MYSLQQQILLIPGVTVSHILFDFSGPGARIYFNEVSSITNPNKYKEALKWLKS